MKNSSSILEDFKSALMFITILPAGRIVSYSPAGMIKFFPVVGLLIGIMLAVFDLFISKFFLTPVTAVCDVIFLVVITGAFHMDGLADTADGLFSHRSRQRVLEIMKDSRIGSMGVVAIFCVLALKTAGIYSIKAGSDMTQALLLLIIIPSYSRAAMIFGIKFLNYGRQSEGTGFDFFKEPLNIKDFAWVAVPVVLSFFTGFTALLINTGFVLTLLLVLIFYKKQLGCITGDMLGALNEIMEAVLFLSAGITIG